MNSTEYTKMMKTLSNIFYSQSHANIFKKLFGNKMTYTSYVKWKDIITACFNGETIQFCGPKTGWTWVDIDDLNEVDLTRTHLNYRIKSKKNSEVYNF